jgi:hypothetical protein
VARIGHVGEHLHHADQGANHAERRGAVADGAIDLAALVEMHQEIVAVALHIVADEFEIIAVGDVANALGQERLVGLDLFQADRPLLTRDFRDAGKLVDQIARRQPAQRECKFRPERNAVQDSAERKPDHGGGDRTAEHDDHRMFADEHVDIAAHEHDRRNDDSAEHEPNARHNIHGNSNTYPDYRPFWTVARPIRSRATGTLRTRD